MIHQVVQSQLESLCGKTKQSKKRKIGYYRSNVRRLYNCCSVLELKRSPGFTPGYSSSQALVSHTGCAMPMDRIFGLRNPPIFSFSVTLGMCARDSFPELLSPLVIRVTVTVGSVSEQQGNSRKGGVCTASFATADHSKVAHILRGTHSAAQIIHYLHFPSTWRIQSYS